MQETRVPSLGREGALEEQMATHSSILAWEIPGTEEPSRLQFMWLQTVRHNLMTKTTATKQCLQVYVWELEIALTIFRESLIPLPSIIFLVL